MQQAGKHVSECDPAGIQSASSNVSDKHWLVFAHSNQGVMVNKVDATAACK